MTPIQRTFSPDDQLDFARLAGDWNPLHIDPIASRRTMFGAPVVHGIHLLLWAIDRTLDANAPRAPHAAFDEVAVKFRKPALVGATVELRVVEASADGARIEVWSGEDVCMVASWTLGEELVASITAASDAPARTPAEERRAYEGVSGEVALSLEASLSSALFPAAHGALHPLVIADLLATTRIVGMHCPGLHSVFAGATLTKTESRGVATARYAVTGANQKYSTVALHVDGATLAGRLDTFIRPTPSTAWTDEVVKQVAAGEFEGQRALVVGGSRGIGEAIARVLGAGGARVCITYRSGREDAERVAGEISRDRQACRAVELDVTAPDAQVAWPFAERPTHVYYLATPQILAIRKSHPFRPEELRAMLAVYVEGLLRVVRVISSRVPGPLVVWAPSTTALDGPASAPAYCIAKAAQEELCRQLPAMFPGVVAMCPRVGRVATDQTAGLIQTDAASPLTVALDAARAAHAARGT